MNISSKIKNSLYIYFSANILSKFFLGFAGILLAKFLSKEDFGLLKTITTFIDLIGIFVNFGLNDLLLFKISKNIKSLIKFEIVKLFLFNYIAFFPICLILFFIIYSYNEVGIILLVLFYLKKLFDWIVDINNRILQAKDNFLTISIIVLVNSLLMFTVVVILYTAKKTLTFYGISVLLVSVITAGLSFFMSNEWNYENFKKNYRNLVKTGKVLVKSAFPFFISSLMAYIYMQSDILMLSIIEGPREVSRYTVVTTIIFAAYLIPTVLYNYFLPKVTLHFKKRLKLIGIFKQFLIYILIFVVPLGIFFFFFSEKILKFLYTQKYLDSFIIFKILSIVFIFHSFCFLFGALLTASGSQVLRSKIQLLAAIINVSLNFIFIPFYKAEGAAFATAITEIFIFVLYLYFTIKVWWRSYHGKCF